MQKSIKRVDIIFKSGQTARLVDLKNQGVENGFWFFNGENGNQLIASQDSIEIITINNVNVEVEDVA